MTTKLRGATVRRYLEGLRETMTIAGATEHTFRAPLIDFLKQAATELGFGAIDVHSELRLAAVGQPDLQLTNADGAAVGYGETKVPGSATRFAEVLASEQVERYRAALENLLVTDFLRFTLFRPDVGRLDVILVDSPAKRADRVAQQRGATGQAVGEHLRRCRRRRRRGEERRKDLLKLLECSGRDRIRARRQLCR